MLECVNGDYGDYTNALAEAAKKPEWRHDYDDSDSVPAMDEVQVVKISSSRTNDNNVKNKLSHSSISSKHMYPPPEWMRLWLLMGRCHVQIYRDWVGFY